MPDIKLKVGAEAEKIPGYLLWRVSRLWQRKLNSALTDLKLSSTQAIILINVPRLNQENKVVTQMLLAEVTLIDRMTLSQSIRTLERKGLIKRVVPANNKRAYHVELTASGKDISMLAVQRIIAAHQQFFASLAQNEGEYVTVTQRLIEANNIMEGTNETNN